MSKSIKEETPIKLNEKFRTYVYQDRDKTVHLTLKDVTELIVRESGNHRLKTKDGNLHIMSTGWKQIIVSDEDWTV